MSSAAPEPDARPEQAPLVAIDLGSNSFHMIVARQQQGRLVILDRLRQRVQLAEGLGEDKVLSDKAIERGLVCLARFEQRLRPLPDARVRAVGTNTLRKARNARAFIDQARVILGHPIEVISGAEEARLIYLGVAHDLADDAGRRLVIDIGGGSTECTIGERFEAQRSESLHMGCVSHTRSFFGDGKISRSSFRDAVTAARVELEPIKLDYRRMGWLTVVGASGTINAVEQILRATGYADAGITMPGLRALRDALCAQGRIQKLSVPGLSAERAPVIAGGLAILLALFKSLRIEQMTVSGGALREGLLYDDLGRIAHEDVRDNTIERLIGLHHVDREQSLRVEATARQCLEQVAYAWDLHHPDDQMLLSWAARLHELGRIVSFASFHAHGAYLLAHSDMPGFSRDQQQYLGALVGAHRRRLKPERLEALKAAGGKTAVRLAALLRLAATLNRSRSPSALPPLSLVAAGDNVELSLPEGWLDAHPMTSTDLAQQHLYLQAAGLNFSAR